MLSRSLSDCQSLALNVMIRVSQFVRWVNCVTKSLNYSQRLCLCLCLCFRLRLCLHLRLRLRLRLISKSNAFLQQKPDFYNLLCLQHSLSFASLPFQLSKWFWCREPGFGRRDGAAAANWELVTARIRSRIVPTWNTATKPPKCTPAKYTDHWMSDKKRW